MPFNATNSGSIKSNNPVLSSNKNPIEGVGDNKILFNSVTIRSLLTIFMRPLLLFIASSAEESTWNCNWLANLMARNMRKGSSEKVVEGSRGVLISFCLR